MAADIGFGIVVIGYLLWLIWKELKKVNENFERYVQIADRQHDARQEITRGIYDIEKILSKIS